MAELRKEVRDLIVANEKIQSAVLGGRQFTDDEAELVRMCARELLAIPAVVLVTLGADVLPQRSSSLIPNSGAN